ncbi:MAG: hypothetical protein Q8P67_08965, partial [archaeon]|nr:hypothetical protein [archaeon]
QDIFAFGDTVCALVDISSETRTYRSRTQTLSRAHADNSLILHSGECGLCSSTQDLSVYLQGVDLSRVGTRCAVKMGLWDKVSWKCKAYMRPRSRSDQEDELNRDILDREMVDCWRQANTGLTDECIKIWAWDSISAACGECKDSCMNDSDLHCLRYSTDSGQLCPCLQCDHQCYDPIFTKFTGLTRRRAGLPSEVPRPCNAVFTETWVDRSIVKPPALPSHSPTRQHARLEEQQRQETEETALRSSVSANYYAPVCNVSSYGFSSSSQVH